MAKEKFRLLASIPPQYSPDFMERLDRRTVLGRAVIERYETTLDDLGGREALSNIEHSLVRRFVWFEVMLEGMECRAAGGEEIDIGAWTQVTSAWLGIARLLGLKRRAKPIGRLRDRIYQPEQIVATISEDEASATANDANEEGEA